VTVTFEGAVVAPGIKTERETAMLDRQTSANLQHSGETEVFTRLESNVRSYARSFSAVFTRARGTEQPRGCRADPAARAGDDDRRAAQSQVD